MKNNTVNRGENQTRIYDLQKQLKEIEHQIREDHQKDINNENLVKQKNKNELSIRETTINLCTQDIEDSVKVIVKLNLQNKSLLNHADDLRSEWRDVNSEEIKFKENEFICPTCKREFESFDVDTKKGELTKNFNIDKIERLKGILEYIESAVKEMETNLHLVHGRKVHIQGLQNTIESTSCEIEDIKARIEKLQQSPEEPVQSIESLIECNGDHRTLTAKVSELKSYLNQDERKTEPKIL